MEKPIAIFGGGLAGRTAANFLKKIMFRLFFSRQTTSLRAWRQALEMPMDLHMISERISLPIAWLMPLTIVPNIQTPG